mgnify:FL=1
MNTKTKFDIIYTDEAIDFLNSLDPKVKDKVIYNIDKSRYVLDKDLFKKLGDSDIWEFRTKYQNISYRLLAFWDNRNSSIVIATHGFVKKTQKTPKREIERAERIKAEYYNDKKKGV